MSLQNQHTAPTNQIPSVIDKVISMSTALSPVARLLTRSLYSLLNSHHLWFETCVSHQKLVRNFNSGIKRITTYRSQNIWKSPSTMQVVYSDASGTCLKNMQ